MKILRRFAWVLGICVVWSLAAHSGEAPAPELKTAAVAAFKNGLAFVLKQGDVRLEAGVGNLEPVPSATLGSLWIAPNDANASLDRVVARRNKLSVQKNLTLLADVQLANAAVESQTDDGKSEKLAEAIAADNPLSRMTWEVTLQAGEEKVIKYRYKVWLRV